jgi:type IV pilus assembly protein PilA
MKMLRNLKKREGFTLIELMIVVAIIGILAAIAIPNFIKFQLRSKAGEGKINLAAVRTAEESYFAEVGTYLGWAAEPTTAPVQQKLSWVVNATPCSTPVASTDPGYCLIGWGPEGDVYYQYAVAVANTGGVGTQFNEFFADGVSDIDGDGALNTWGIHMPDVNGTVSGLTGVQGCTLVKNIADPTNGTNTLAQVGPCEDVNNGRNVF